MLHGDDGGHLTLLQLQHVQHGQLLVRDKAGRECCADEDLVSVMWRDGDVMIS